MESFDEKRLMAALRLDVEQAFAIAGRRLSTWKSRPGQFLLRVQFREHPGRVQVSGRITGGDY